MVELLGSNFNVISGKITSMIVSIIPIGLSIFGVFILIAVAKKLFLKVVVPKLDYHKNRLGFYDDDIELIDDVELDEQLREDLSGNLRGYDDLD